MKLYGARNKKSASSTFQYLSVCLNDLVKQLKFVANKPFSRCEFILDDWEIIELQVDSTGARYDVTGTLIPDTVLTPKEYAAEVITGVEEAHKAAAGSRILFRQNNPTVSTAERVEHTQGEK